MSTLHAKSASRANCPQVKNPGSWTDRQTDLDLDLKLVYFIDLDGTSPKIQKYNGHRIGHFVYPVGSFVSFRIAF